MLALLSFNLFAQSAESPSDFDSTLRLYGNDRWLYGNPQRMFEEFERFVAEAPIRGGEWTRQVKLDDQTRKQVRGALAEFQKPLGVIPPTASQIQNQHQLWSDCIVESCRLKMTPEKKVVLHRAKASGIFQVFPRFAKALEDWPLVAMANISNASVAKASDANLADLKTKDKNRFDRLNRYQGICFTVTNSFGNPQQV